MDKKSQKLLESLKNKKVGIFCDDSNLYHEENMAWGLRQCWHLYLNRIRDIIGINTKTKQPPGFTLG